MIYNLIDHHIKTNPHKKQTRVGTWRGIQGVISIKNPRLDSIIGCVSGLVRWGDISKSLKTEIEFNYKLCFHSNTFNSCIQNEIQPQVEFARFFPVCTKKCQEHKKLSAFYHPHKIGCVFKRGLYLLCNTTCG